MAAVRPPRLTGVLLPALGLVFSALPLGAQTATPAYSPLYLDGATYHQVVRSVITIVGARERTRETSLREGRLRLQASGPDSLAALEAWFDSLTVWREGGGERLTPDTDGVIGGRFRGDLTRLGGFRVTDVPFVPDELAQVTDLATALADLLPPLPSTPLSPGQSTRDDFGTSFLRVPDGVLAGRRVERYRLVRQSQSEELRLLPDSTEVRALRQERESGVFSWSREVGLVRWDREVTVEVQVPAGGVVRQPFRTVIEQTIVVERAGQ